MFGLKVIAQMFGVERFARIHLRNFLHPDLVRVGPDTRNGIFESWQAVRQVFDEIRSDSEFVWDYVDDGCLARAHKMCRILKRKGFFSEKIRIENASCAWCRSYGLAVPRGGTEGSYLHIHFHLAVLVRVREGESFGELVLDPAFFDRPVSLQVWSALFVNSDSLSADGQPACGGQDKYYSRMPWDCFDRFLFFQVKDPDLKKTNAELAPLRLAGR